MVVLAHLERPAALGEQGRDRARRVVQLEAELGHPGQGGALGGAVAEPLEHAFPFGDHVEEQPVVVGRDELLRPPQQVGRLVQREDAVGPAAGPQVPVRGRRIVSLVEVLGDDRRILLDPSGPRGDVGEPERGPPVVLATSGPQHAVVCDVAQQGVLEEELTSRVECRQLALEHEIALQEVVEGCGTVRAVGQTVRGEVGHRLVPEDPADDRSPLQHRSLRRGQGVETRLQQSLERRRHDHPTD